MIQSNPRVPEAHALHATTIQPAGLGAPVGRRMARGAWRPNGTHEAQWATIDAHGGATTGQRTAS